MGIFFTLLLLEGLLRLVALPTKMELNRQQIVIWQADPELLLHLKPDLNVRITAHPEFNYTIQTNADGLRDDEMQAPVDIAAIGDSFTFGFGVDEPLVWPTRLEELSGLEVANLGWAGWNSYVYPAAIKRHAVPLQARIWIWNFYVNDLLESAGAYDFLSSGQTDFLAESSESVDAGFPYNLRVVELLIGLLDPQAVQRAEFANAAFKQDGWDMRLSRYAWKHSDPTSPDVQLGWELTESALAEAQALAAEQGATILLVHIPSREQVYWPIIKDAMPDVDVAQLEAVSARLETLADSLDIHYFDLLPGLRAEAEQGQQLYFPVDGHWNPAGHAAVARLIYDQLHSEGLLPS